VADPHRHGERTVDVLQRDLAVEMVADRGRVQVVVHRGRPAQLQCLAADAHARGGDETAHGGGQQTVQLGDDEPPAVL
jgi:hypothetical protein